MLLCQNNAAETDGLFNTYYAFNKILSANLKTYHQISSNPEMDKH